MTSVLDLQKSRYVQSAVEDIFKQLNDNEKEQCARASSYKYLKASRCSADERDKQSKIMIERYVSVEKMLGTKKTQWENHALAKLRNTLKFRQEMDIDDVRTCFDKNKKDSEIHATIRERLEERFACKSSIIRGYSKCGRALILNFPSFETEWEEEYFIKGNVYMLERALACTESRTSGEKTKVMVFYNYNGFTLKNSPPPAMMNRLLSGLSFLRDHWPERLEHVFLVDTPFIFRAVWAIIKHFIDPITKRTVQFITGEEQKELLRELIDKDQAAPFMFEGGKNVDEADMKKFFYDIPFDEVYTN